MEPHQKSLFGHDPSFEKWQAECETKLQAQHEATKREAAKHLNYTFYFCGKISHTDWRHYVVDFKLRDLLYPLNTYRRGNIPLIAHGLAPGLHYGGPFFIGCDHGCYHGENAHGAGVNKETCCYDSFDDGPNEPMVCKDFATEVAQNCLASLRSSDIIFAWLDDLSAYGSFAEIGAAHALGKQVWIGWPKPLPDLWFIKNWATVTVIAESATIAFRELLFSQLHRSLCDPRPPKDLSVDG